MVQYTPEVHELPKYDIAADLRDANPIAHLIYGAAMQTWETLTDAPVSDEAMFHWQEGRYDAFILALGFELKGVETNHDYEQAIHDFIAGEAS